METIYFVGNPVLDAGKKFYPVRKAYRLSEEEAARKMLACVAITESSHVIEYFEDKRSAESYVDAMIAQTEGL